LMVLVAFVAMADTWRFNRGVNATRMVNNQRFDRGNAPWSPEGRLNFMVINSEEAPYDLRPIIRYIQARGENFFLMGDSSVLYGATGRPSISPVLWFHPGLTMPPPGTPESARLDQRLYLRMRQERVSYIVEEGSATWTGAALADFPTAARLVAGCPSVSIGLWSIRDICH
jgi:hypothetical protein